MRCDGGCGDEVSRIALSPMAKGESPADGRPRKAMVRWWCGAGTAVKGEEAERVEAKGGEGRRRERCDGRRSSMKSTTHTGASMRHPFKITPFGRSASSASLLLRSDHHPVPCGPHGDMKMARRGKFRSCMHRVRYQSSICGHTLQHRRIYSVQEFCYTQAAPASWPWGNCTQSPLGVATRLCHTVRWLPL